MTEVGGSGMKWSILGQPFRTTVAQPGKPYYTGTFRHALDDKNRLTIPSAWRSAHTEEDTFLATPHPDGYIAVLPPGEVAKLHEKVAQMALSNSDAQDLLARFFADTLAFTFDKQGRIGLTESLRQHAGIDKDTVLVGSLSKFSIYNPDRWEKVARRVSGQTYGDLMRQIGL